MSYLIQCTVADGDTTSNIDCDPFTAKQLAKSSGKIVLLEYLLQKLQNGGHKVLIFSQMFCVFDCLEYLLRVKQYKYERIFVSKSDSHWAGAVDHFSASCIESFFIILRKRVLGMGLDLSASDTYVIFDIYWNTHLRMNLFYLCAQRR